MMLSRMEAGKNGGEVKGGCPWIKFADLNFISNITRGKLDGFKDAGTNVSPALSRRDMAMQMSPEGSSCSSPSLRPSLWCRCSMLLLANA
ncbi:hypothetical protein JHK82_027098 [Glycine max]|uniref:Uncharacterized protein n=1 Tax=Glycine soja TaxID=3848 RepID=A0A0B2QSI3_GLYSO|nr:hypothetical protein JHK85_027726 [Glycine max]KAG5003085.1 hypothetical protein JHK86_027224 [Glycine max]KAG5126263.1 hypothetical protein JHK82_027098 [Glycine max]KAG5150863.1 hypothetical protein JHK84_027335 [Glycine max]KHN24380.1 hypothetical protein glysoja_049595 [Glycine soja]